MHHQYLRYFAPGFFNRYGGLESPSVRLVLQRKDSYHNNIERLNVEHPASMPSKVVQLTGRVQLDVQNGGWPDYQYLASEYTRHALFIKDKSYPSGATPVYLVDFNSLKPRSSQDQSRHQWRMRYRSMGDFTSSPNGTTGWNAVIRSSTSEPSTHIFMSAAEFNPTTFDLIHFNETIEQRDITNSENIALDNVSGTHFNTMALILPHQAQTLSYTPYKVPTHNASMPAAAWVNQLSTDIIDVIALRGTNLMPYHVGLPVAFNVPAADDFQITLLSSRNFGFARLVRSGGVWSLDSDYSVGIDPSTYSVAANASITLNNASLSSAYQVHVHDNASVTLTGSGTISNKNGASEIAPEVFPAYPNPFNPVTLIPVQLNQASDIRMEVFDVIGRRVALLADGPFQAGRHEIQFDASRLSSGLYLIRTFINGNMHVQRVTLVK